MDFITISAQKIFRFIGAMFVALAPGLSFSESLSEVYRNSIVKRENLAKYLFSVPFLCLQFFAPVYASDSGVMSMENRVRARLVVGWPGSKLLQAWSARQIRYGGYIAFKHHFSDDFCNARDSGHMLMVDHEGGMVNRLSSPLPSASKALIDSSGFKNQWRQDMQSLRSRCFSVVLGPSVDTRSGSRSFSQNPVVASDFSVELMEIALKEGIVPVLKHYPGEFVRCLSRNTSRNTISEDKDCDADYADSLFFWSRVSALRSAPAVMTSFFTYRTSEKIPAFMDPLFSAALRSDLAYDGLMITDAINESSFITRDVSADVIFKALLHNDMVIVLDGKLLMGDVISDISSKINSSELALRQHVKSELRIKKFRDIYSALNIN